MKAVPLTALCLLLTGCGARTPAPSPPPQPASFDIASIVFSPTEARQLDTGQAWVFASLIATSAILVTYNPSDTTENHSVFTLTPTAILLGTEEGYDRPPLHLLTLQTYGDHKPWINARYIVAGGAVHTCSTGAWDWRDSQGHTGHGRYDDCVDLALAADGQSATLREHYADPAFAATASDYCMQRTYQQMQGKWAMTRIDPATCAGFQ